MSRWIDILQDLNFHKQVVKRILYIKQGKEITFPKDELEKLKLDILSCKLWDEDNLLDESFSAFMENASLNHDVYIIVDLLREKEKYPHYPDYVIVKDMHYYVNDENRVNSIGESPAISYENLICCWVRSPAPSYPNVLVAGPTRIYCKDGMLHRDLDKPAIHSSYGLVLWKEDIVEKPLDKEEYRIINKNPHETNALLKAIILKDTISIFGGLYYKPSRKSKPHGIMFMGYKEHWNNNTFKGYGTPGNVSQFWEDSSRTKKRKIYDFVEKFKDEIDPFSNEYYLNEDVEFLFMADIG